MKQTTESKALWEAAKAGDWAARAALADWYTENADSKPDRWIATGLRFCVKHRKSPWFEKYNTFEWDLRTDTSDEYSLPFYFSEGLEDVSLTFDSEEEAIRDLGQFLLVVREWSEGVL